MSQEVRAEARKRGIEETREDLQNLGNAMRAECGAGYWAYRTAERIKAAQEQGKETFVIDGLRNPAEINALKETLPSFYLVATDAPPKTRFDRIVNIRKRESDLKNYSTYEGFLAYDLRDQGLGEPEDGQQVRRCISMAHHVLWNDGTLEEFQNEIRLILARSKI
ncbi:hypothetical protein J4454_00180 [Candidatus Pacearchaeota archaeon]|nr:hypothetical protein [Candidatus Pacearchaeota archaeon]